MSVYFQPEAYHRPRDLAQAIDMLSRFRPDAKLIAGGTDLLPRRPGVHKLDHIKHVVDISSLDLNYLKEDNGHIRIGAAVTINAIGESTLFSSGPLAVLPAAAGAHSTATIRNRATVGGNLCTASSGADFALPMLVLDAVLVAAGPNGNRQIPIEDFFKGANYTALNQDEVLLEIRIPLGSEKAGTSFLKLRRHQTAIDTAVVNVATRVAFRQRRCELARIALGAVAPIPFRAGDAESVLNGAVLDEEVIQKAAAAAAAEAGPIDDVRATSAYRRKMIAVLVRRSLENSLREADL